MNAINDSATFYALFKSSGLPKAGLTGVTCTIRKPDSSTVSATVSEVGNGLYKVTYTLNANGNWFAQFTAPTGQGVDERLMTAVREVHPAMTAIMGYLNDGHLPAYSTALSDLDSFDDPNSLGGVFYSIPSIRDAIADTQFSQIEINNNVSAALIAADSANFKLPSDTAMRLAKLDANVSSRSSHSVADIWAYTARTLTGYGTLIADIWNATTRTLTTSISGGISKADVKDAMTEQGYTSARGPKLDALDAAVSTRASASALASLGSTPITLVSPMTSVGDAEIDLNWDFVSANGMPLVFSGVGFLDQDECGLYLDGALVYSGAYTSANGGTIKVDLTAVAAAQRGRGTFRLELGYRKGTVKTLLKKVRLRVN